MFTPPLYEKRPSSKIVLLLSHCWAKASSKYYVLENKAGNRTNFLFTRWFDDLVNDVVMYLGEAYVEIGSGKVQTRLANEHLQPTFPGHHLCGETYFV